MFQKYFSSKISLFDHERQLDDFFMAAKLEILIIYVWTIWIKISWKEISRYFIRPMLQLLHITDLIGRHGLTRTGKSKFVIKYWNNCNCCHGNARMVIANQLHHCVNVKHFANNIMFLYISHLKKYIAAVEIISNHQNLAM